MNRRTFLKLATGGLALPPLPYKVFSPFVESGPVRRFAIIADTQYWQPQIEEILTLVRERPVEFTIVAGDVVGLENSTGAAEIETQWQWTRAQLDALGEWYAVPGNHDLGTAWLKPTFNLGVLPAAADAWGRYVGPRQFVIDLDYTRIVGVDYSDWSTENQEWIAAQLATDKRKVVVSHYPLTGVIPKYLDWFDWLDWWSEEKAAFFQGQGVDLFICGHRHQLGLARLGTMTQIICPSIAPIAGENMPDPAPDGVWPMSYPMRGWLEFTESQAGLTCEVFRSDGAMILSYVL